MRISDCSSDVCSSELMVDARAGMTPGDQMIAEHLRKMNKRHCLVANKFDSIDPDIARAEFSPLGLGDALPIAAAHGRGITHMLEQALGMFPKDNAEVAEVEGEEGETVAEGEELKRKIGRATCRERVCQ